MIRPRLTVTRIALAGAGLLTAAGIGAAAVPQAISSTQTAAATTAPAPVNGTTRTPAASPKAGRLRHLGIALRRLLVTQTATQTGMTVKQVRAELRSGKSLATIAGGHAQSVESAVLATVKSRLDAARTAGKITQAQETKLLARARKAVDRMMAATPHHTHKATTAA